MAGRHVHDFAVRQLLDERVVAGLLGELGHASIAHSSSTTSQSLAPFAMPDLGSGGWGLRGTDRSAAAFGAERALVVRAAWIASMFTIRSPFDLQPAVAQPTEQNGQILGIDFASRMRASCASARSRRGASAPRPTSPRSPCGTRAGGHA